MCDTVNFNLKLQIIVKFLKEKNRFVASGRLQKKVRWSIERDKQKISQISNMCTTKELLVGSLRYN
jgi:hypothetical protein